MTHTRQLIYATRFLHRHHSPSPALDARLLLAHALGESADRPLEHSPLPPPARIRFARFLRRRAKGEPVARIVRRREFWSLPFILTPAVLDPRPDSETLVEAALKIIPDDNPARVLDIGTGSGALLLAFLSERPNAIGIGLDCCPHALAVAQENAATLGLTSRTSFVAAHWTAPLKSQFDLILSNPPYIPSKEIAQLAPDVRLYDPHLALDGGKDGLDAYRTLAPLLPPLLADKGRVILETGNVQAKQVQSLLASVGLRHYDSYCDLGGHARAHCFGHT